MSIAVLNDTEHWTTRAACKGADPGLFFLDVGQSATRAQKLCARCPVRDACLDYALTNDIRHGIWGGIPEGARRRHHHRRSTVG